MLPLILLTPMAAGLLIVTALALRLWLKRWLNRQIGGYTGDCLGAAQQLAELSGYLVLLLLQHQQINLAAPWLKALTQELWH